MLSWKKLGIAVTLAGAVAAGHVAPASADNLFDLLFGGGVKRRDRIEPYYREPAQDQVRRTRPARSAPAEPVTSEEYFTYRADSLVPVDLRKMRRDEQTAAVVPAAFVAGAAAGFGEALGEVSSLRLLAEPEIAKAIAASYADGQAFLWSDANGPNERARAILQVLQSAGSEGLDALDYAVTPPVDGSAAERVRFDLEMSARALRYVHDVAEGRIDPNRISGYYDFPRPALDYRAELSALSSTADPASYLAGKHPRSPEYAALLAEYRALTTAAAGEPLVDMGLRLKPGQSHPQLPALLSLVARDLDDDLGGQFGELIWQHRFDDTYGPELVPLFKALQERAGLRADGVIGPKTIAKLVGEPATDRIAKLAYALEQLRWLPRDFGPTHVFVNQPAFTATFVRNGIQTLTTRVVVGAPATQTSFFYDEIEQVDFNPYWGVPQSILVKEMLPRLRRDPGYLDRAGYEVHDARGRRVPSRSIAWGQYGSRIPYDVRQVPSEANALGELKILFPNEHAIYMHDTPSKSLFERDVRAFSHGCIRLQDPRGMAAEVLDMSRDEIAHRLAQGHSSQKVATPIPVYIAYFTAWPDQSGKVEYFADVYKRDGYLQRAIDVTRKARSAGT